MFPFTTKRKKILVTEHTIIKKNMEKFYCDSCNQEMKLNKDFGSKPRGKRKKIYRIRRFNCELCNLSKLIFADGKIDEIIIDEIK